MNLKPLARLVTSKVGRQVLTFKKHSPTIFFVAGIAGVIGTVVLASRATLKLDEVLEETNERLDDIREAGEANDPNYDANDQLQDKVYVYTQAVTKITVLYAPAVALGLLSIGALTGSHIVLTKRNMAVTAAYAALDKGFREYRQRIADKYGAEKEREFRYDTEDKTIVEETETGPVTKTVTRVKHGSIYSRLFDQTNINWCPTPGYNRNFISTQQNYANDLLRDRGHVLLNDVYDMLGMERSKEGCVVGWVLDGGNSDNYIDFGVFEGDRERGMRFVMGTEMSIWLDFNVDGVVYDKI